MTLRLFCSLCAVMLVLFATPAGAQEEADEAASLLLILDASGSMQAKLGNGVRLDAAKQALDELIDALPEESRVGLRVYGHRVPNTDPARGCKDTELVASVRPLDRKTLRAKVRAVKARGFTPMAESLLQGAEDLPASGRRTIVLVSDGIETCAPPQPCKVARDLSQRNIRVDVVGFNVRGVAREQLRCIADAGGGSYEDARSAAQLADRLQSVSLRPFRIFQPEGESVAGTDSPESAPMVSQGSFVDDLSPGADRWYALRLSPRQTLSASVTVGGTGARGAAVPANVGIRIYGTEMVSPLTTRAIVPFNGATAASVGAAGPTIASDGAPTGFSEDGIYLVRVSMSDVSLAKTTFPMELTVEVEGEAKSEVLAPLPESSVPTLFTIVSALLGLLIGAWGAWAVRRVVAA